MTKEKKGFWREVNTEEEGETGNCELDELRKRRDVIGTVRRAALLYPPFEKTLQRFVILLLFPPADDSDADPDTQRDTVTHKQTIPGGEQRAEKVTGCPFLI